MTQVVENGEFAASVTAAEQEPVVQHLAAEIRVAIDVGWTEQDTVMFDGGDPRFEWMQAVNAEYRRRTGHGAQKIGTVPHAVLNVACAWPRLTWSVSTPREGEPGTLDTRTYEAATRVELGNRIQAEWAQHGTPTTVELYERAGVGYVHQHGVKVSEFVFHQYTPAQGV